jgi:hypothetical protein
MNFRNRPMITFAFGHRLQTWFQLVLEPTEPITTFTKQKQQCKKGFTASFIGKRAGKL